jgi:5-hydroxyisourate hydrolase-like protein (transthyretin family)
LEVFLLIVQRFFAVTCFLFISSALFAAQLTGTVTNATTGKPAAGDEITLLSLNGGMQETSSAHTDAQGKFALDEPDDSVEHLIRVNHAGAFYYKSAPVGTRTADMNVYDVSAKVDGIREQGHVFQMQTGNGQLEVSEKYILRNESSPPRTRMSDNSFEIDLPPGATLIDAMAAGPGGLPVKISPAPSGRKNHYGIAYPLRPGETQFRINYKVPYSGSFDFKVTPQTQLSELGVILPKTMQLNATGFTQDNDEAGMSVFFTKDVSPTVPVKFSVTGEGVAPREAQEPPPPGADGQGAPASGVAPGSSPSWYIIGILFGLLAGGAIIVFRKMRRGATAGNGKSADRPARRVRQKASLDQSDDGSPLSSSNGGMTDVLKEELFQLESDRLEGRISQQDYETAKAGLDTLIRRQMGKTTVTRS